MSLRVEGRPKSCEYLAASKGLEWIGLEFEEGRGEQQSGEFWQREFQAVPREEEDS